MHYAIKAGHYDELEELVRVLFRVKSRPVAKLVINMPADVSGIILIFVCSGFIYLWATMSGQWKREGLGRGFKFSSCKVQVAQLFNKCGSWEREGLGSGNGREWEEASNSLRARFR